MADYASGINLDALMVPTKAATVFAAQESSLYLSGAIVPMITVPAGSVSAQVPVMGQVTAQVVTNNGDGTQEIADDFTALLPGNTKNTINLDLHAARTVLRDLGGVSADEMGRIMGNAIAASADKHLTGKMAGLTQQELAGAIALSDIFEAVSTIRGNGDTGQLYGIVSTDAYTDFMAAVTAADYAGTDFQTEALRNGFIGRVAGINCFVSSYLNNTNVAGSLNPKMAIFGADAMRGALQGGVNLEVQRRAAAVGFDVVASAAFGAEVIDASRGVLIKDAA